MKTDLSKKQMIIRIIFFAFLGVISFLFVRRLFLGMDVSDEALNLSESYRVGNGNRFLVDVWDYFQLGDAFFAPFLWLFVKITGSTEGIVLFSRLMYLVINAGVGFVAYWVLKDYFKNFYAKISVSFAIAFYAPFSLYYLWYDTAGQLFLLLGVLFLLKDMKNNRKLWKILAGLFHGFMVIAYPSSLVVVAVEFVIIILINRKSSNKRGALFYACGGFIPVLGLIIYGFTQKFDFYLLDNPVSNVNQTAETAHIHYSFLNENLGNLFSRGSTGIIPKIWNSVKSIAFGLSEIKVVFLLVAIVLFVFAVRYCWKKEKKLPLLIFFVLCGLVSIGLGIKYSGDYNRATIFGYFFMIILVVGALVVDKTGFKQFSNILFLAAVPSCVFFLIISITSTHGGSKALMGLWIICVLGIGMYIEKSSVIFGKLAEYINSMFLLVVLGLFVWLYNSQYFETDETNKDMNYRVESGTYKGLWVSDSSKVFLDQEKEIKELIPDDIESIAIFDEYPSYKYISVDKKIMLSESGRWFRYIDINEDYGNCKVYWERFGYPDILLFKNSEEWFDEELITNTSGCNYQKIKETENYVVFRNGQ